MMIRTLESRLEAFSHLAGDAIPAKMQKRMTETGYFTAPAAAKHHGNYEGGLYDHSEAVALALADITKRLDLTWERPESPYIVGFLHDFCKVDDYIVDPETGGYRYKQNRTLPGHGEKSVILVMREMYLTDEEIMCIRYHMGAYEGQEIWGNLGEAVKRYPNILWTHTADMLVSQILGV